MLLGQICGALSSGVVTVFFAAVVDFWSARCGNVNNHSPRRYKTDLTVALHMGVISDPTVDNATISPVLNNIVPNGSMTL